jgi:hypothetical protein
MKKQIASRGELVLWRSIVALMVEAVQTSETLVNPYQSAWHYNPEDIFID